MKRARSRTTDDYVTIRIIVFASRRIDPLMFLIVIARECLVFIGTSITEQSYFSAREPCRQLYFESPAYSTRERQLVNCRLFIEIYAPDFNRNNSLLLSSPSFKINSRTCSPAAPIDGNMSRLQLVATLEINDVDTPQLFLYNKHDATA
jgi:hypothetical protein